MTSENNEHRVLPAREAYDLVASEYDSWHWKTFWERNEQPLLERCLGNESPILALDIGCGTGAYCRVLERRSVTIGLDPSLRMLAIAKSRVRYDTQLVAGRAGRLPIKASTVGLAIAARSLSHEKELAHAVEEVARITVPGGLFIVSDLDRGHDYPRTQIPFGDSVIQIETYKRTSLDIINATERTGKWRVELVRNVRWKDLEWLPSDRRFYNGVREGERNVFFVVALRRR